MQGVRATRVGYTGGTSSNPTYKSVCSGKTGHSEAIKITFDPKVLSYQTLLNHFFSMHPYQYKSKPQYMSAIFWQTEAQKVAAEATLTALRSKGNTVATQLLERAEWHDAEAVSYTHLTLPTKRIV